MARHYRQSNLRLRVPRHLVYYNFTFKRTLITGYFQCWEIWGIFHFWEVSHHTLRVLERGPRINFPCAPKRSQPELKDFIASTKSPTDKSI